MTGNRAIHQNPEVTSVQDGDVFIVSRPSGGTYVDRSIDASGFPQQVQYTSVLVPSASVLDLFDNPFEIIPAPAAGTAILVKAAVATKGTGSTDYATATDIYLAADGGTNAFLFDIASTGNFPLVGGAVQGTQLGDGAAIVLTADANPTAGNYDILFQVWYQVITL
jgi:hypothetical protein